MKSLPLFTIIGFIAPLTACNVASTPGTAGWHEEIQSPDGRVRLTLMLVPNSAGGSAVRCRVSHRGKPVLLESSLGVELADGACLGANCNFEQWKTGQVHSEYTQLPGKRSHVVDSCNEGLLTLRECAEPGRLWQFACRVYDDAVAFRYVFPAQPGWSELVIAGERTRFTLPSNTRGFELPLNGFTTSYEKRYEHRSIRELPANWLLGLPLLLEIPGTGWAAITEANLTDYAGLYLARDEHANSTLVSRLSPRPGDPTVAVRAALPHVSPWRVIVVGPNVGRLIESDTLLNLNAPCAIADTSWIHTGKTTFPWWNGYFETDVPFAPGLNTATTKYYIDFCADAGFPYHTLDGRGDTAWYGGPIVPYQGADPTTAVEGMDLPEVLRYAKSKGVGIRVWMHWRAAEAHMARAFPLYRQWGIQGVMLDFMDRDDQEMVHFMHQALRTAAENQLTVVFHGVSKPTGLERTWPNLLTSEAVLNLEYDKWDPRGVPPEHEIVVACTRMLAGPLDFHQGSLRTVPAAEFKPRNEAPLVIGTPCRTLASYVVFQNHLSMVADYPSAYRGHPALPVLAAIPTTWDDTRVLEAIPGEVVAIARRSEKTWWIGGMTNRQSRELSLPLGFLGPGTFAADVYSDDSDAIYGMRQVRQQLDQSESLDVTLAPGGGFVTRLDPTSK